MKKKSPFSDLAIGIGAVALGVAVVILASGLQKVKLGIGPGGFPRFIGAALILLGAVQLGKTLKNGVAAPAVHPDKKALLLFLSAVAACFLYVAVVPAVGFLLATPVLLFVMLLLYGNRRYLFCAALSVAVTVCVWALFTKVFLIFLPAGRLL